MAKSSRGRRIVVCVFALYGLYCVRWSDELRAQSEEHALRHNLTEVFTSQIGVQESGGNNRGPEVESYLQVTGTPAGLPWCASFVSWCFQQAGLPVRGNAWSPSWFPADRIVYHRDRMDQGARPGDVFGIWFQSLKRIGHVGFVYQVQPKYFVTVEGNTNDGGSREGDGVYKRYRPKYAVYKIADHVSQ